jgi:hypothetical protein
MTTAAPACNAGIASPSASVSGKFQGLMIPTTGYGRYWIVSFFAAISGECGRTFSSPMNFSALLP